MSATSSADPIELRVDYRQQNALFADYIRNISRGGTFISTERPLPSGTRLVFALHAPGLREALNISGKVTWVTEAHDASKANPAGMGIELVYPNRAAQEALCKQVEDLMATALGSRLAGQLLGTSS